MSNQEIINNYLQNNYNEIKQIIVNITKNNDQYVDDLTQEICLILLDYDQTKLSEIIQRNHIKFFVISIVLKQFNSSTSPFYRKYRNNQLEELNEAVFEVPDIDEYNHEDDVKIDFIKSYLDNKSHWYVKRLYQLKYDENLSYQEIKQLTNIPRSSLFSTIDKTRKKIRLEYDKQNKNDA